MWWSETPKTNNLALARRPEQRLKASETHGSKSSATPEALCLVDAAGPHLASTLQPQHLSPGRRAKGLGNCE